MSSNVRRLVLSLVFSFLAAFWVQGRVFWNPDEINDDVRNQVYWMARLVDPGLYPNDLIADYFTDPSLTSPFLMGIYGAAAPWLDPVRLTQFMPFALVLLASLFLFKAADRKAEGEAGSRLAYWAVLLFNGYLWTTSQLAGGLARGFFYPLFFLFLWMLLSRRWKSAIGVLWLQTLVYPPVLLLSLGLFIWEVLREPVTSLSRKAKVLLLLGALGGGTLLMGIRYLSLGSHSHFGPLVTGSEAAQMAEFHRGGRVEVFQFHAEPSTVPLWERVLDWLPSLNLILPFILALAAHWTYKRFLAQRWGDAPFPPVLWRLSAVSAFFYAVAWAILMYLYIPERYLRFSLPLVPIFLLAGLVARLETRLAERLGKNRAATPGFILGLSVLVLTGWSLGWTPNLHEINDTQKALYSYLYTLPKDTLVAASRTVYNDIPLYARRSVLVSYEAAIPFHRDYYREMRERLRLWIEACYAVEPGPIHRLLVRYPVDYLVVNSRDFQPQKIAKLRRDYFKSLPAPFFDALPRPANTDGYLLLQSPSACVVYRAGSYTVISADRIRQGLCFKG